MNIEKEMNLIKNAKLNSLLSEIFKVSIFSHGIYLITVFLKFLNKNLLRHITKPYGDSKCMKNIQYESL